MKTFNQKLKTLLIAESKKRRLGFKEGIEKSIQADEVLREEGRREERQRITTVIEKIAENRLNTHSPQTWEMSVDVTSLLKILIL